MDTKRLRELRAGRRVPLDKLGEVIGKSKVSYSKKERGEVKFQPNEVLALAEFYSLTYEEVNAIFYGGNLPNGNFAELKNMLEAIGVV